LEQPVPMYMDGRVLTEQFKLSTTVDKVDVALEQNMEGKTAVYVHSVCWYKGGVPLADELAKIVHTVLAWICAGGKASEGSWCCPRNGTHQFAARPFAEQPCQQGQFTRFHPRG